MIAKLLAWIWLHPLLTYLGAGAVLSSVWRAVRSAVWADAPTARLPVWARIVQALVECLLNLPGAVKAATASETSTPPRPTVPPAVIVGCLMALALLASCKPAGQTLLLVTPGAPPQSACQYRDQRCANEVPEVCSESGRFWPAYQEPCPHGCVLDRPDDGGLPLARCAVQGLLLPVVYVDAGGDP